MNSSSNSIKGRGAASNPTNRFEVIHLERDSEFDPSEEVAPATVFLHDTTQTIINYNDSPDVGFDASVNPYRGCEHGCIYCFARPTHEYLGFSAGLEFESRIMVKLHAPTLLRKELAKSSWKPQVIAMSGVTDCYQPVEKRLRLTRGCLEVLAEHRNPVCIITKSHLVTRDVDILSEMSRFHGAAVHVSVTSLDPNLARVFEPRAASPAHRLDAIQQLRAAGVQVGVLVAPVVPALTDHEMPAIIKAAVDAGAMYAGYVPLRLPFGLAALFEDWLGRHFPDRKENVLNRIKAMRGGKLNDPNFGSRMRGEGIFAEQMNKLFHAACKKAGLGDRGPDLRADSFRIPGHASQLSLFA